MGAAHVEAGLRDSKRLIDDLVTLAKTGSVQMEPDQVDLSKVVSEVFYEQDDLLLRRRVELSVQRELPAISCNRKRAKQVLTNLIRNAAIHGCDPQNPQLQISAATVEGGGERTRSEREMVRIIVHDNGPGIPHTAADDIFAPGVRISGSEPGGTGMGLAIVRRIAEYYGGSAYVDQDCQSGTAIAVLLLKATPA